MTSDSQLVAFKAIHEFVSDLEENFGKKSKALQFYNRIIKKTQISNTEAILKNVQLFSAFCSANKEAILKNELSSLKQTRISYSEKIFIDFETILENASEAEKGAIRRHLLLIYAALLGKEEVVEVMDAEKKKIEDARKNSPSFRSPSALPEIPSDTKEGKFLNEIVQKVASVSDKPDANPMDVMTGILQSGMVSDMMKGLQTGEINIGRLLGTLQGVAGTDPTSPESKQISDMIGAATMLTGGSGGGVDMSAILKMMGGMGMGAPTLPKIEEEK